MHPLRERMCDDLLNHPSLRTPPPEPERPKPPRVRKPRVWKMPPRFPLISIDDYNSWCSHLKRMKLSQHKVDDAPPSLYPELYLKPRRLDFYARQLEANMEVNKELLIKINRIQRTGGFVDCWNEELSSKYNELLCRQRQRQLDEIRKNNIYFYSRLLIARSEQPLTKELDIAWEETKHKLLLTASLPFVLFTKYEIHKGIHDPAFDKPADVYRRKVAMDIWVRGGSKIGRIYMQLFTDLAPNTCKLFLGLIKGDEHGYGYQGTRIFRVVPDLYCRGGDVCKNNGYGCYLPDGLSEPMGAENYDLHHSVPGVISMVVTPDNEVCGQFNIIFKPLPQFDGKHVVFGRVTSGPPHVLERLSALGRPLGSTYDECEIRYCGYYTRRGDFHKGKTNTQKFPPFRF